MKSSLRSPAIKRATLKAQRLGFRIEYAPDRIEGCDEPVPHIGQDMRRGGVRTSPQPIFT